LVFLLFFSVTQKKQKQKTKKKEMGEVAKEGRAIFIVCLFVFLERTLLDLE
jgi:hypothetical protein